MALNYFLWEILVAVITLQDNGLELALGVHSANNLFILLFVNTLDSALTTPAIWTYVMKPIHAGEDLISTLLYAALFYFIFFGGISRRPSLQLA